MILIRVYIRTLVRPVELLSIFTACTNLDSYTYSHTLKYVHYVHIHTRGIEHTPTDPTNLSFWQHFKIALNTREMPSLHSLTLFLLRDTFLEQEIQNTLQDIKLYITHRHLDTDIQVAHTYYYIEDFPLRYYKHTHTCCCLHIHTDKTVIWHESKDGKQWCSNLNTLKFHTITHLLQPTNLIYGDGSCEKWSE